MFNHWHHNYYYYKTLHPRRYRSSPKPLPFIESAAGPLSAAYLKKNAPDIPPSLIETAPSSVALAAAILDSGTDIRAENHYLMRWASENADMPLIQFLHARGDELEKAFPVALAHRLKKEGDIAGILWLREQGTAIGMALDDIFLDAIKAQDIARMEYIVSVHPAALHRRKEEIPLECARYGLDKSLSWLADRGMVIGNKDGALVRLALISNNPALLDLLESLDLPVVKGATRDAMHFVCGGGNQKTIEWLLDRNAPIDIDLCTFYACTGGHYDFMLWLIAKGGSIEKWEPDLIAATENSTRLREIHNYLMQRRRDRHSNIVVAVCDDIVSRSKPAAAPSRTPASLFERTARLFRGPAP